MNRVLQRIQGPNILEEAFRALCLGEIGPVIDQEILEKSALFHQRCVLNDGKKNFDLFTTLDPRIRVFLSNSTSGEL